LIRTLPVELLRAFRLTLFFALVTGLLYSLALTGVIHAIFPSQASGSLIMKNGQLVGSSLIGQQFRRADYFHGRPSANGYAADNSAGSNLGPNNAALVQRVQADADRFRQANSLAPDASVPVDIVTTDFSGFDPDISEAAALLQVHRVAGARGLDEAKVRAVVEAHVQGRVFWVFGEPHVNVLDLNLALDSGAAS